MQEAAVYSIVNPVWGEEKRRIKNRKNKYECVVAEAETYRKFDDQFPFWGVGKLNEIICIAGMYVQEKPQSQVEIRN